MDHREAERIGYRNGIQDFRSVRINCIGLVDLHHLFYKGVADPLWFQGVRHPWCRLPYVPPPLEAPPLVPPPLEPALGGLLPP
jgi:hypothetical protein